MIMFNVDTDQEKQVDEAYQDSRTANEPNGHSEHLGEF